MWHCSTQKPIYAGCGSVRRGSKKYSTTTNQEFHMPNQEVTVQLTHVSKIYQQGKTEVRALDDVSLNIPQGNFIAIMGASGSGKSTLLYLIAGLTTPSSGDVQLFGQVTRPMKDDQLTLFRRRNIALIFQTFNLLPTMTTLENVCLPLMIDGKSLEAAR